MLITTTLAYLSPDSSSSSLLTMLLVLDRLDVLVHQGGHSLKDHLRYNQAVSHINDFISSVPPPTTNTTDFPTLNSFLDTEPMPIFLLHPKQSLMWTKTIIVLTLVATHVIILHVRQNLILFFMFQIIGAFILCGLNGLGSFLDAEKKMMEQHTIRAKLGMDRNMTKGALAVTLLNPVQNRSFLAHMLDDGEKTDFQTYRKTVRVVNNRVEMMLSLGSTIIMVLFPRLVDSGLLFLLSLLRRECLHLIIE
jgi:hypothetical protein